MPLFTLREEGLTKGAITTPTALWNAPHKAAPACDLGMHDRGHSAHVYGHVPPPPCISYALVQALVGVGTVIILYIIEVCTKCSVAT